MTLTPFASIQDMQTLWRPMTTEEQTRAEALLPIVSDSLRQEARFAGVNLDQLIENGCLLQSVVKSVTVDVTARALMTPTNEAPMSQISQSALGYSASGTYLVPGGGLFIKKSELARLGLRRQRIGVIDLDFGHRCDSLREDEDGYKCTW